MNYFFLDASALAKRFSREVGAVLMDQLFSRVSRGRFYCLLLGAAEVTSVLVRRHNNKVLSDATFLQGMTNLRTEIIDEADFNTLPLNNEVVLGSLVFIETHSINSNDA